MNNMTWPCATLNLSQGYNGSYSHAANISGSPKDYPVDEAGSDTGRSWLLCPCDEMTVYRIYGVGGKGTNTVWLVSSAPVVMPCGTDFVTLMAIHPEDDDLSKLKVGQRFKRGEKMFREGMDGQATGNHFHLSFGRGKPSGNGWVSNSKSAWVLTSTGGPLRPEEACYLDKRVTTIQRTQGITFRELPAGSVTVPRAELEALRGWLGELLG